jgi:regulator of protease activity HflC (stomatin/prohibitin superfamily)
MTDTPTRIVVDCSSGEATIVPLSAEEIAERELLAAQAEAERQAQEEAAQALADLKASAKAKLIAGEPLTAEEADCLVL